MCVETHLKSKQKKIRFSRKRNCESYVTLTLSYSRVELSRGKYASAEGHDFGPGRPTVAWLTTINNKWAQEKAFNAVPLYESRTEKSTQVHHHL